MAPAEIILPPKLDELAVVDSNPEPKPQVKELVEGDTTWVDVRLLGLNGQLKIFELNKETLEIKEARIAAKKMPGTKRGYLNMVAVNKNCRYIAATCYSDAIKKFKKKFLK